MARTDPTPESILDGFVQVLHRKGAEAIPEKYREAVLDEEWRRICDDETGLAYFFRWYGMVQVKGRGGGWKRFMPDGEARVHPGTGRDWAWQAELCNWIGRFEIMMILKARQIGMTFIFAVAVVWAAISAAEQNIAVIANKEQTSRKLVRRARETYRRLPYWMRQRVGMPGSGITHLEFSNGSAIEPYSGAADAARSEAATWAFVDEVGEIDNLEQVYASVEACTDNGGHVVLFGTATPKGAGTLMHQWCIDGESGDEVGCILQPVPDTDEPRRIPVKHGLNDMGYIFLPTDLHPARDEKWFASKRKNYRGNMAEFDRNYPRAMDDAFVASGVVFYDQAGLKAQLRRLQASGPGGGLLHEERDRRGTLIWADEERRIVRFVPDPYGHIVLHASEEELLRRLATRSPCAIGADCAGDNKDGDYHAAAGIQVGNIPYSTEAALPDEIVPHVLLATIHGHMDSDAYAALLVRLGYYLGTALLAIEANGVGHAVLKEARRLRYPNLYMRRTEVTQLKDKQQRLYGWHSSQGSKHVMHSELERLLRNDWIDIRDLATLNEMKDFRHLGGGQLGAKAPKHDDRPTALAIACAVAPKAKRFVLPGVPELRPDAESIEAILAEVEAAERASGYLGAERQDFLAS